MKKTVSLLLALALAAYLGGARAGGMDFRLFPGAPAAFTAFTGFFDDARGEAGRTAGWSRQPYRSGGYEVYETRVDGMDDGTVYLSAYTLEGNVEYLAADGAVAGSGAGSLAWLREGMEKAYYAGILAMYFAEYGEDGPYSPEEAQRAVMECRKAQMDSVTAQMEKTAEASDVTAVLGYPTGIRMYLDGSSVVMHLYILNRNSEIWTE